ncbi:dipeptide transport system permease protein [Marininema mesophilum]|uniref:Dipeptide transport system permease protein n=1 Tax=Marininema mesophilum TaxID=1048340 RepID=A0A1H2RTU1_9BACL|nr:ABC transporter permease [Marininema mesophilum]SDW22715.1 dipeptide transport system permease protein [Marininema mesophilum]
MTMPAERFESAPKRQAAMEVLRRPSVTYWQDVWRRLRKNHLAIIGLIGVALLIIMAIIGPYLQDYSYYEQNLGTGKNLSPSGEHLFGTDDLGRDVFVRVWYGARISLVVGFAAALMDLLIGVLWGGIAGYKGGRIDEVMMRIVDVLWGLPYLLIVILILVVMDDPGLLPILIALSITGWLNMARLVRGQILQLKEQEFVMAAQTLGASTKRLMLKHLIPNVMGPIIVMITFTVPTAIFAEAFLSFLGLGIQAPFASWGTMINDSLIVILMDDWWRLFFPAFFLSMTLLVFNFLGDGLRDALDPKMRK